MFHLLYDGQKSALQLGKRDFLRKILFDADRRGGEILYMDKSFLSRICAGTKMLPAEIAEYYELTRGSGNLEADIKNNILPLLEFPQRTLQEIRLLVETDPYLFAEKKAAILHNYGQAELFLADVLRHAMCAPDIKKEHAVINLNKFITGHKPPKPCPAFCGRDNELAEIDRGLTYYDKLFVAGSAGIGKTEVVAAYAYMHLDDFANVIWLHCEKNLYESIGALRISGNPYAGDDEKRFCYRDQILRSLDNKSLLILDDVNWPMYEDQTLQTILHEYDCKILISTRCAVEESNVVQLDVISTETDRLELFRRHYNQTDQNRSIVVKIMEALDNHTMAIELAARLLQHSMLTPASLLAKIRLHNLLQDVRERILFRKNNTLYKERYTEHIKYLFRLSSLDAEEQQILRGMAVMPQQGVEEQVFGTMMQLRELTVVDRLVDLGSIRREDNREISLQSLLRETIIVELTVAYDHIESLLESIDHILRMQWHHDLPDSSLMTAIMHSLIDLPVTDTERYLRLLHNGWTYCDNHGELAAKQMIYDNLKKALNEDNIGTNRDRALLLSYEAGELLCDDMATARALFWEADGLIVGDTKEDVALKINLLANIGMASSGLGDAEYADVCFRRVFDLYAQHNLGLGEDTVRFIVNYCSHLINIGKTEEAKQRLLDCHQEVLAIDYDSILLADIETAIANACIVMGNSVEASQWYRNAYRRRVQQVGAAHPLSVSLLEAIEYLR